MDCWCSIGPHGPCPNLNTPGCNWNLTPTTTHTPINFSIVKFSLQPKSSLTEKGPKVSGASLEASWSFLLLWYWLDKYLWSCSSSRNSAPWSWFQLSLVRVLSPLGSLSIRKLTKRTCGNTPSLRYTKRISIFFFRKFSFSPSHPYEPDVDKVAVRKDGKLGRDCL